MAKGGGDQTVSTKTNLSRFQKQLVRATKPFVQSYLDQTSPGGVKLPDKGLVQGFNPNQWKGQEMALDIAKDQGDLGNWAADTSGRLLGADAVTAGKGSLAQQPGVGTWKDPSSLANPTDFLLNKVLYPESNPALQGTIDAATRPITEQLLESALPAIRGGAVTSGNFGSSRQGIAEGLATGRAARAVGDTAAGVANQGYLAGLGAMTDTARDVRGTELGGFQTRQQALQEQYRTRQGAKSDLYSTNMDAKLKALGLLPSTMSGLLQPALTTSAVGDVRQGQGQRERDEDIYRALFEQMSPLLSAQNLVALSGAVPGGSISSTGPGPSTNPLSGALGGASLGSMFGPFGALGGAALGGGLSFLN